MPDTELYTSVACSSFDSIFFSSEARPSSSVFKLIISSPNQPRSSSSSSLVVLDVPQTGSALRFANGYSAEWPCFNKLSSYIQTVQRHTDYTTNYTTDMHKSTQDILTCCSGGCTTNTIVVVIAPCSLPLNPVTMRR